MLIKKSDEYNEKMQTLFLEVDYSIFQEKATLLINHFHDETTCQEWSLFCKHLNEYIEKKPVKLLLMQLVCRCLEHQINSTYLAQLITLSQHIKEVYGLKIYRDLLEADVPSDDRKLSNYLAVFQLLIDMNEVENILSETRKRLPDLQNVLSFLYKKHNNFLEQKYPQRNIDTVLDKFVTEDEGNKFQFSEEVLREFKADYLAIKLFFNEIKSLSQEELKNKFLINAIRWRENKIPEAKHLIVAILIETIRRIYKILPYDTQIIAFLALIHELNPLMRGRIAQIKAGEGKSTVFAMLVAFKAAQGNFVDLITSSYNLAIRDYDKYRSFLLALGLTSSHISYTYQKQQYFHGQILYGTHTNFESALLNDGSSSPNDKLLYSFRLGSDQLEPRTPDIIFIDEVDNMMLDAAGATRMAISGSESSGILYKPILDFVINEIKNQSISNDSVRNLKNYLQKNATYKLELSHLSDAKLLRWLGSAQIAYYQKIAGRDYIVDKDIVIVDYVNTGRTNKGSQWQHGIHQFLQAKHGLPITSEALTVSSIAHPSFFNRYAEIYGLTGTIGELVEQEEIQEIYSIKSFNVPIHLPCQRIVFPSRILPDEVQQKNAIFTEIKKIQKNGRPILILFESITDSNSMSKFLREKGITHQLLNETQRESENYIIGRAGNLKMVTIATNTAGRGTDILLSPESKEAGGLHQIFAFYPENSRVEEQGKSRAARQGQPGSCSMILHEKDSRILSLLASSSKAILLWINAKSDEDKMTILNQLRTNKIQHDSLRRRYYSKLESLYFDCLNKFFIQLQSLYKMLDDREYKEKLKQICANNLNESACLYSIDIKNSHWQSLCLNAKKLLNNQRLAINVDWSFFIEEYITMYTNHILKIWGNFYSKLPEEVERKEIDIAEKMIKQKYDDLNLAAQFEPEIVLSILNNLLYKVSLSDEKEILRKSEISPSPFFTKKPKDLYDSAVQCVKDANYDSALKNCELAIEGYLLMKGECSIELGVCYSTQATCYRELKLFEKSLSACEESIRIFSELTKKGQGLNEMSNILKKYNNCLEKSGFDISLLYPSAVQLFKNKNYIAASYKLLYLIEGFAELNVLQKGHCYSTLASCYRELNEKEKATESCLNALAAFQQEKKASNRKSLIDSVLAKLEGLKGLSNQQGLKF